MAKKVKKQLVPRTRNANTMTDSMFWGWIRSSLRRKSIQWKPVSIVKNKNRRSKPVNVVGRHKFEYKCAVCGGWFQEKEIQIDHIIESGSLTCAKDLPGFVERLFCEEDGLQVICNKRIDGVESCHRKKTNKQIKKTHKK